MPEFLSSIRIESAQHANGVIKGGKSRATREAVRGKNVNTIASFPQTKSVSLAPTDFHIFQKAGMPKGKK